MTFQYPWILIFLVIPLLVGAWEWLRDSHAIPMPFDGARIRLRDKILGFFTRIAHLLPVMIMAVAILIMAGPRRLGPPEADRILTNILFALDLSGSMSIGFGDNPYRSSNRGITIGGLNTLRFEGEYYTRYHAALDAMNDFASMREGDAFGLTLFGSEYLHWLPVTRDIKALKTSACLLNPNSMPRWFGGTRIVNAIRGCIERMKEQDNGDKLLIVITDGESQDFMNNADQEAANELRDANITTYFISIDPDISSRSMQLIASTTGGEALSCGDKKGLERIFKHIDQMEKSKMKQRQAEMVDYNAPFGVTGLVLASLALLSLFGLRFLPW